MRPQHIQAEHFAYLEGRAQDEVLNPSRVLQRGIEGVQAAARAQLQRDFFQKKHDDLLTQLIAIREDIATMNKSMNEAARENGLCEKFDEWVNDINDELTTFQLVTKQTFTFSIQFDLDITLDSGVDPSDVESELENWFYQRLDGDRWVQEHINGDCENVEAGHPTITYEKN